jgi:hypothetical protein
MYPAATFPSTFSRRTPRNLAAHIEPGHALIGVKGVVDDVLQHVATHISSTVRVSPVEIAATSRSGKSTVLFSVYHALSEGTNEPVLVSFNGDSGFKIRDGEPPMDAFCRAFYEQLTGQDNYAAPSPDELLRYLELCEKPLVVLLDELNVITPELGDDTLATFLRDEFLDKPSRYLVFTCHYPMDVALALGSRGHNDSGRPHFFVGVPVSVNVDDYTPMFSARRPSPVELVLWGGVCGLVWTAAQGGESAARAFDRFVELVDNDNCPADPDTQRAFFGQVLNGDLHAKMTRYLRFTHFSNSTDFPIWPLCFIVAFLKRAGHGTLSDFVRMVISECTPAFEHKTGMEWQTIVLGAIAIRIAAVPSFSLEGVPKLVIGEIQEGASFMMVHLPLDVKDVRTAEDYLASAFFESTPLVVLAYATHPSFAIFDGLVLHFDGTKITQRIGLQSKQGSSGVTHTPPHPYHGFLFRGDAPRRSRERCDGWTYLSDEDVQDFLPASFKPLYPRLWPK